MRDNALLLKLLLVALPWRMKRWFLRRIFRYEIDPSARIGFSWVYPKSLRMGKNSRIDHFTVAIHLDEIELMDHSSIGRSNWITGYPSGDSKHFGHQTDRRPRLSVGEHSAITKRHYLDCTHQISIGRFTTVAGHQSELLTHSIDIFKGRQDSRPIEIGDYCFVGTRCVFLGGSRLPSQSVLAAGAVLTQAFEETYSLYGGVPARRIKDLPKDAAYFHRGIGFVA
jgi:acetyltransferase-like isoleucine patch superfamily enzyme